MVANKTKNLTLAAFWGIIIPLSFVGLLLLIQWRHEKITLHPVEIKHLTIDEENELRGKLAADYNEQAAKLRAEHKRNILALNASKDTELLKAVDKLTSRKRPAVVIQPAPVVIQPEPEAQEWKPEQLAGPVQTKEELASQAAAERAVRKRERQKAIYDKRVTEARAGIAHLRHIPGARIGHLSEQPTNEELDRIERALKMYENKNQNRGHRYNTAINKSRNANSANMLEMQRRVQGR